MTNRFEEIARRKQALMEKARLERIELAAAAAQIRSPLNLGRPFSRFVRTLGAHPLMTAGYRVLSSAALAKSCFARPV